MQGEFYSLCKDVGRSGGDAGRILHHVQVCRANVFNWRAKELDAD